MRIIKRDGSEVPFDRQKIRAAIEAANAEVTVEDRLSDAMVGFIVGRIEQQCGALGRAASVEEIQDMIEDKLLATDHVRLMRHYSDYRLRHALLRKQNTTDKRILALLRHTEGMNPDGTHKYYGRFNQGAVTINLVDVACSSGGDEDAFWRLLDERCELCHKALRVRHETLLGTQSDVAPILWQYGAIARLKKGERIDRLLYNNYSTISLGYAGLSECVYRMKGCSHTDPQGHDFAVAVMRFLNDKCARWREAESISYSLYGTPMPT